MVWAGTIMELFENATINASRGELRTNVLVDSAFHVPLDNPKVAAQIFDSAKWGSSVTEWGGKIIQPSNIVDVLKQQLQHYAGHPHTH